MRGLSLGVPLLMLRILLLTLLVSVIFWGGACSSVSLSPRPQGKVGQFAFMEPGVAQAYFSGRSVESGWYFLVCNSGTGSDGFNGFRVRIQVVNQGSAVWIDYLSGSALLERGDSVDVYQGPLDALVRQCDPAQWQWVAFKRDNPEGGFVNLLVIIEFGDSWARAECPVDLHAWYSQVLPGA